MQQKDGSFFGVNGQGNYSEHFVHQNVRPVVANTPYHQTHEDIIQNRKEFLPSWHTTNEIFRENDARLKLFNGNGGELFRNYKNQETHPISNNSSPVCGISRQSVVPRSFSHPFDAWGGNEEFVSGLEGINSSNVDRNRYPLKNYEALNQDTSTSGGFDVESKEPLPKYGNTQLFSYINNDNYNSKVVSIQSPGTVFLDSHSGNDRRQNSTVMLNEAPYSCDPRNFIYHSNDQNYKCLNTQANNFVMKPEISTSKDTNLPKCSDVFATAIDHVVKNQNDSHSKFDECDKIKDEKCFPEVVEKLWDGSLQLNSCITASMIAFYKSGERIPDVNWSELIEVKGKVRLDAFEKYIQDLPHSRNRGLMVISLSWKSGSSQAGLKSVKEVAERYEQGEKVGLAQLSTGIDLYICPTSDSIITLLVKYGFLKGTLSSEENPGSLIGCVVWRKTLFPTPKPDDKTAPPPLPAAEAPPSPTFPLQQHPPVESSSLHEGDEGVADPSSSERNPSSGPHHSTAKETEPAMWSPNQPSIQTPSVEVRPLAISEPNSELKKPAEFQRDGESDDDDDDLPEYDFSYANSDGGMVPPKEYDFLKVKYEPPPPPPVIASVGLPPLQMPPPTFSRKRSLFDDDDMPEWQPPDLDPPEPSHSGYQLSLLTAPDREKRRNFGFYGGNGKQ